MDSIKWPIFVLLVAMGLLAVGNLEFCNLRLLLAGRPFHITWRKLCESFQRGSEEVEMADKEQCVL
jgi:hypothetical protein